MFSKNENFNDFLNHFESKIYFSNILFQTQRLKPVLISKLYLESRNQIIISFGSFKRYPQFLFLNQSQKNETFRKSTEKIFH
jgi:hypothetical protein